MPEEFGDADHLVDRAVLGDAIADEHGGAFGRGQQLGGGLDCLRVGGEDGAEVAGRGDGDIGHFVEGVLGEGDEGGAGGGRLGFAEGAVHDGDGS